MTINAGTRAFGVGWYNRGHSFIKELKMHRTNLCALVVSAFSAVLAVCQVPSSAVVAVTSGSTLSLYNAAGTVVQRTDLKRPVAGFAFSPDRNKLVVVSPDTEHGGALIEIDLKAGARRRLTDAILLFAV